METFKFLSSIINFFPKSCESSLEYLGSTITVDGSEEREVTRKIQAGWKNWREVSGVLCDRRIFPERESLQDSSTTSHDVWHGGYTNQEGEREKNECGRDEDVEVDVWSDQKRQNT